MRRWWFWFLSLRRGDELTIVFGLIALLGFVALAGTGWTSRPTAGFGPGWHCTNNRGTTCFKDTTAPAAPAPH